MQREISDRVILGDTLNPYEDARRSTAIELPLTITMQKKRYKISKTLSILVGMIKI